MSIYIKNPEVDKLARKLAKREGSSVTAVIYAALRGLDAARSPSRRRTPEEKYRRAKALIDDISKLPVLDSRSADEILGFNEHGVFD
jgi:antitoxin VapB